MSEQVQPSVKKYETATETLVHALERFGEDEPESVIVIWTTESGDVIVRANVGKCMALGMMEMAKKMVYTGEL
jgi:hypothetical protein